MGQLRLPWAKARVSSMSRYVAYGFGLSLVALVASKGLGDPDDDSYPLSTFPMFARARERPRLSFVEGVDRDGQPVRLTPELVASGEVMQAAATVRRAVAAGPEGMRALCDATAARIAESERVTEIGRVRIVAASFDPVRYFVSGPEPEERVVHWECAVVRTP